MQLSKKLGKIGVLVGNCRGFVGNRMFGPYRREAQFLIEEGADVDAVDRALVEFGNAMGPLAVGDLAGLDVGWRIRKECRHLEKPGVRQPFAEDRLCEMGRYGQKTGKGWYQYDENRRPSVDPEVTALVRKWSADAGVPQRKISADEIVDRCIYALVNEGARILEEGYALRAVDIDIIYLNGYGFPAYRGGPMWYADTVGLQKVYQRICEFHKLQGELWAPAPLLQRLAETGKTFADFDKEQKELEKKVGHKINRDDLLSYLLYPEVFLKYDKFKQDYSDVSVLPTPPFFFGLKSGEEITVDIEAGKTLIIKFLTASDPHPDGTRTLFFELNGQPREVNVRDRALRVEERSHPKADPSDPGQIGAPTAAVISSVAVQANQKVERGAKLMTLEAMKMQSNIYATISGKVSKLLVTHGQHVEAKDLLVQIVP